MGDRREHPGGHRPSRSSPKQPKGYDVQGHGVAEVAQHDAQAVVSASLFHGGRWETWRPESGASSSAGDAACRRRGGEGRGVERGSGSGEARGGELTFHLESASHVATW